jgi:hypothetical protein
MRSGIVAMACTMIAQLHHPEPMTVELRAVAGVARLRSGQAVILFLDGQRWVPVREVPPEVEAWAAGRGAPGAW